MACCFHRRGFKAVSYIQQAQRGDHFRRREDHNISIASIKGILSAINRGRPRQAGGNP